MTFKFIDHKKEDKSKQNKYISRVEDGIQHIDSVSDIAQTIKELNADVVASDKFSSIDMKSRLRPIEISGIIAVDSLVTLDFLPPEVSFITRSKKRLSVSEDGKGREEVVRISQGQQDQSSGTNMFQKMGNWLKGGN